MRDTNGIWTKNNNPVTLENHSSFIAWKYTLQTRFHQLRHRFYSISKATVSTLPNRKSRVTIRPATSPRRQDKTVFHTECATWISASKSPSENVSIAYCELPHSWKTTLQTKRMYLRTCQYQWRTFPAPNQNYVCIAQLFIGSTHFISSVHKSNHFKVSRWIGKATHPHH